MSILQKMKYLMAGYLLLKVVFYTMVMVLDNDIVNLKMSASISTLDLLFYGSMLFLFRPRMWPSFFALGINELQNQGSDQNASVGHRRHMAPLLQTLITEEMLKDQFTEQAETGRTSSIDSNEAVIILNPTEYTVKEDYEIEQDHDEVSAF